jgi:acylphosphatase
MPVARIYTIKGRVQGVFFRASTRRVAESLGITGHAINLPDGDVEVIARDVERPAPAGFRTA